ncbi:MAG: MFS transporter [Hyphomicrobiaceae bacterium]
MLPILAWLTGAVFFFYAWILRVAPSVMVDELMRDLAIGAAAVGNLSAFYFYGYAGLQIPVGMLIDRFGPRRLMTVAGGVCGLGCILFALSGAYWGSAASRWLIGASAAFSLVGAMAIAGQWFPASRFALLSGLAMMFGMAGGVFGQAPLRIMVEHTGWRDAMLVLALGGGLVAVAAWTTIRDRRRGGGGLRDMMSGLGVVMRNRQTWLIAAAGLGTTGPLLGFAGLWGVPYLSVSHGLEPTRAAAITSTLFVGWGIGAPLFGWFSDWIGRRRWPFMLGLLVTLSTMAAIVYVPGLPVLTLTVLCFLCGFGGSSQIIGFAAVREHNAAFLSGTAIGFVNCAVTGTGALYQPLIGWVLDLSWQGQLASGVRVYDAAAYRLAFGVIIAGAVLGLICAFAMRETYCRQSAVER